MKISIIVPVYNSEKSLHKCIDSILTQSYKDFELILIDDGSSDKSGVIIDEFSMKDIRITTLHNTENEGLSEIFKKGIQKSQGELLTIIDSDDFIDRFYLERIHNTFLTYNSDLVICDYIKHDRTRNIRTHSSELENGKYEKSRITNEIIPNMLATANDTSYTPIINHKHWGKIFKTEIIKNVLKDCDEKGVTDIKDMLTIGALSKSETVNYMKNEYLYYYRLSPILFDTDFFEKSTLHYNNISKLLGDKYDLTKEFYYLKINMIIDSIFHQTRYINTVSKRKIINKLKAIALSDFTTSFVKSKNYPLSKKQALYLFLLKKNMYKVIYYILKFYKNKI